MTNRSVFTVQYLCNKYSLKASVSETRGCVPVNEMNRPRPTTYSRIFLTDAEGDQMYFDYIGSSLPEHWRVEKDIVPDSTVLLLERCQGRLAVIPSLLELDYQKKLAVEEFQREMKRTALSKLFKRWDDYYIPGSPKPKLFVGTPECDKAPVYFDFQHGYYIVIPRPSYMGVEQISFDLSEVISIGFQLKTIRRFLPNVPSS